jgi:hypothetical protein
LGFPWLALLPCRVVVVGVAEQEGTEEREEKEEVVVVVLFCFWLWGWLPLPLPLPLYGVVSSPSFFAAAVSRRACVRVRARAGCVAVCPRLAYLRGRSSSRAFDKISPSFIKKKFTLNPWLNNKQMVMIIIFKNNVNGRWKNRVVEVARN